MFRTCVTSLQKRMTATAFMASAGKTGGEEKYAQVAMEYLYERSHHSDPKKREADIKNEAKVSQAYDRYSAISEAVFQNRIERLTQRSSAALEAIPHPDLLEEALLLNSEHLPLNFPRPSLTPPIVGFQCGFGVDVPQLRADVHEFPRVVRPSDKMQYGETGSDSEGSEDTAGHPTFPFVEADAVGEFTKEYSEKVDRLHGGVRRDVPLTGASGEGWEAYVALNKKALARQQLILDLCADEDLRERYNTDEGLRAKMLEERGIVPLLIDGDEEDIVGAVREVPPLPVPRHYAQEPKYHPTRKI